MSEDLIQGGGPAFPLRDGEPGCRGSAEGMSLRDYFAAEAICGMAALVGVDFKDGTGLEGPVGAATAAYRIADAMIKRRLVPEKEDAQ